MCHMTGDMGWRESSDSLTTYRVRTEHALSARAARGTIHCSCCIAFCSSIHVLSSQSHGGVSLNFAEAHNRYHCIALHNNSLDRMNQEDFLAARPQTASFWPHSYQTHEHMQWKAYRSCAWIRGDYAGQRVRSPRKPMYKTSYRCIDATFSLVLVLSATGGLAKEITIFFIESSFLAIA